MDRVEILAGLMEMLDNINESTNTALNILSENAEITRQFMNEILYGAAESPIKSVLDDKLDMNDKIEQLKKFQNKDANTSETVYIGDGTNTMEELADQIVSRINEDENSGANSVHGFSILFDPRDVDPDELAKLVDKKISEGKTNSVQKKVEDIDEDINFTNFDEE